MDSRSSTTPGGATTAGRQTRLAVISPSFGSRRASSGVDCDTPPADGTVIWVSPAGKKYRTSPAGVDLFPQLGTPACAPPAPNRRSRSKQRAGGIAAARKHNREQRPINERRRWLEQARKREIADRKWRNHMRDTRFIFKGEPSTSPFSTWINDPREPEELPPDWAPEEPATI